MGQGGCLWDPIGPPGWFDESSDDSYSIYAFIYVIHIFSEGGLTGQLDTVQEVITDLKSSIRVWCLTHFGFAVFRREM